MKKNTDELMFALKNETESIEGYLENNKDELIKIDIRKMWDGFISKSGLSKVDIIERSSCGYNYFYCIINGDKTPSRDKIIELSIAMNLSVDDCQTALKYCGKAPLYPRVKRDSIIIYGLNEHQPISEINKALKNNGEKTLKIGSEKNG